MDNKMPGVCCCSLILDERKFLRACVLLISFPGITILTGHTIMIMIDLSCTTKSIFMLKVRSSWYVLWAASIDVCKKTSIRWRAYSRYHQVFIEYTNQENIPGEGSSNVTSTCQTGYITTDISVFICTHHECSSKRRSRRPHNDKRSDHKSLE